MSNHKTSVWVFKRKDRPFYEAQWKDDSGKKKTISTGTADEGVARQLAERISLALGHKHAVGSDGFPLWVHPTGRWCKKINGKAVYFGSVKDDPTGEKALAKYLNIRDALSTIVRDGSRREAASDTGANHIDFRVLASLAVREMQQREAWDISSAEEIHDYIATCKRLADLLAGQVGDITNTEIRTALRLIKSALQAWRDFEKRQECRQCGRLARLPSQKGCEFCCKDRKIKQRLRESLKRSRSREGRAALEMFLAIGAIHEIADEES